MKPNTYRQHASPPVNHGSGNIGRFRRVFRDLTLWGMSWTLLALTSTTSGAEARLDTTAFRAHGKSDRSFHASGTLFCSECHQVDRPDPGDDDPSSRTSGSGSELHSFSPSSSMLLRTADPNELCLSCHDDKVGIPDVVGSDINGLRERSAGHFAGLDQVNPRGHDLTAVSSGGGFQGGTGVSCIDCHDPHGNENPRNLRWAVREDDTPRFGLFERPSATGLERFERDNVAYGTTDSKHLREVTSLCLNCHQDLAEDFGSGFRGGHTRHPSYDSERGNPNNIAQGFRIGTSVADHWRQGSGSGFEGTARVPFLVRGARNFAEASVVEPGRNAVFCLSCHKAHGSDSAFGLVWKVESGLTSRGCDQCHAMQSPSDAPDLLLTAKFDR